MHGRTHTHTQKQTLESEHALMSRHAQGCVAMDLDDMGMILDAVSKDWDVIAVRVYARVGDEHVNFCTCAPGRDHRAEREKRQRAPFPERTARTSYTYATQAHTHTQNQQTVTHTPCTHTDTQVSMCTQSTNN